MFHTSIEGFTIPATCTTSDRSQNTATKQKRKIIGILYVNYTQFAIKKSRLLSQPRFLSFLKKQDVYGKIDNRKRSCRSQSCYQGKVYSSSKVLMMIKIRHKSFATIIKTFTARRKLFLFFFTLLLRATITNPPFSISCPIFRMKGRGQCYCIADT